jgi:hypothetical protein
MCQFELQYALPLMPIIPGLGEFGMSLAALQHHSRREQAVLHVVPGPGKADNGFGWTKIATALIS